jgi:hypothetical protein
MKNRIATLILTVAAMVISDAAYAEVTRLGIRFAGGCDSANKDGSCTIETVAFGEDFASAPGVQLFSAPTHNGTFQKVSNFKRKLDEEGRARSRFKNIPGACYQMRIAKTEFQRSVSSDILCETAEGEPSKSFPAASEPSKKGTQVGKAKPVASSGTTL